MPRRKLKPISSKIVNRRAKLAINRSLATARHINKPKATLKSLSGFWNRLEAVESDEDPRSKNVEPRSIDDVPRRRPPGRPPGRSRSNKRTFILTTKSGKPFKRPRSEIKKELEEGVADSSRLKRTEGQAKPRKGYYDRNEVDVDINEQQEFICEFCETMFLFETQFKSHNVNCALTNGDQTPASTSSKIVYKCISCGEIYDIFFDYLNHLTVNGDRCVDQAKVRLAAWDACVCVLCGFTTRRSTMMDHLREEHLHELRNVSEEVYQHCRLCVSQREILTSKSGKFMSPLEFFNHLSSWHPRAILLLKSSIDNDETESVGDIATSSKVVNCRVCGLEVPKCEFESHVLIEHCESYMAEDSATYERKLLYDPLLRRRRRAESPPVPFATACDDVDRETFLRHHRKRCYRWSQFKERRRCSGCGWLSANRNEYLIHVLCNFCKPEYDEFDMRMKCLLCVAVVERNEILTHLCEMHDYELNMKFDFKLGIDESFVNEGRLAREIIGYDWICPHCLVGFDREKKRVQVGHRCRRDVIAENSYELKLLTASLIKVCPFCRARLRNDVLLKLHHRFEHEDARSGLDDPCDDPGFIRYVLESQSEKVSDFIKRVTLNLTNKEVLRSMSDMTNDEPKKLINCNTCNAVFHSYEVYSQHKKIFHSQSTATNSPKMNEVLYQLYRCHQLRIPFSLAPSITATVPPAKSSPTIFVKRGRPNSVQSDLSPFAQRAVQRNLLPKFFPGTKSTQAPKFANPPVSTLLLKRPDHVNESMARVDHPFHVVPKPPDPPILHFMNQSPTVSTYPQQQIGASGFRVGCPPKKKTAPPVVVNSFSLSNPGDKRQQQQQQQVQRIQPSVSANNLVRQVVDVRNNPTILVRPPTQVATQLNFKPAATMVRISAPSPVKQTVIYTASGGISNLNVPRLISVVRPHVATLNQTNISPVSTTTIVQPSTFSNLPVVRPPVAARDVLGDMLHQRRLIRAPALANPNVQTIRPSQLTNNDPAKSANVRQLQSLILKANGRSYSLNPQQEQPKK